MASKGRLKPHSLTIVHFNANGLTDQILEVREFVRAHKVDILLVQETFLKPSRRDPKIGNYIMIRNDRTAARLGGTAIYYRRALHCTPLDPPNLTNMEASVCQVSMTGHQSIILASVYLSPKKDLLESDLKSLFSLGDSVILAGDFNCHHTSWNSSRNNTRGLNLHRLSDREDLNFLIHAPDKPTRIPDSDRLRPDTRSVLDIALFKNIALQASPSEVLSELDSDHRPVLFQLGPPPPSAAPPTKSIIDYGMLSERLKSLDSNFLSQIPDEIGTVEEALAASQSLSSHLRGAITECTKEVPALSTNTLPPELRALKAQRDAQHRLRDSVPTRQNRSLLWTLQRRFKRRLRQLRDGQWDDKLRQIEPSHLAHFELARSLKADPVSATPPLIRPDLPPAFEDIDKAECLADSLEAQCSPSTTSVDPTHLQQVHSELASILSLPPDGDEIPPTTYDEVSRIIKGLKNKKAPGPDQISNKALKLLPVQLINLLVIIFNMFLSHCSFPPEWKEATVIGIPKPGKPRNLPTSYRPISLLNTLAKVYEILIQNRLKAVVSEKKLLNDPQFGFRAKHSCVQQAHRLTEHILAGFTRFRNPIPTGALFFDVAKAFDRVWHEGLLFKLHHFDVPNKLIRLLHSYLTGRTFRYRLDGTLSSRRPIRAGVPQGSVLAPLLYALYTSDIPDDIPPDVHVAQFADDTALFSTHRSYRVVIPRLQKAVKLLGQWFRLWRIEVNPEKSAAVLFTGKPKHRNRIYQEVSLYGKPIPWQSETKYLGVTFDSRMSFSSHIRKVTNRARWVLGRFYPLLCSSSKLSLRLKVTLYKVCIRPIMTYASVVFAHRPKSAIKRLQTVQNKFMRLATGSPWFVRNNDLHRDLDLPTITQHMKQLSKNYFSKATTHPNPLVVQTCSYTPEIDADCTRRRPKNVLYDPDDDTTTDNASQYTYTQTQRLRRRRRGPRFLTSPGRGTHPRPLRGRFGLI